MLGAPISTSSFRDIRENNMYYVDKSLFLDDNPFNGTTDMEDGERKQMLSFFGRFLGNALKDNNSSAFQEGNIKDEWWYGISFMAKAVYVKAERVLQ